MLLKNGASLHKLSNDSPASLALDHRALIKEMLYSILSILLFAKYGMDTAFHNQAGENLLYKFIKLYAHSSADDSVSIMKFLLNFNIPINELEFDLFFDRFSSKIRN